MTLDPAVHGQNRPGGVGAAAPGEEEERSGDVLGPPDAAHRHGLGAARLPRLVAMANFVMLVGNGPGANAFTVTWLSASSAARMRVR